MILNVCVVRDRATDSFGNPFFVAAIGQAVRAFSDDINKGGENNMLSMHPEDFDLFSLGTYDTDTGLFKTDTPRQIGIGKDQVRGA